MTIDHALAREIHRAQGLAHEARRKIAREDFARLKAQRGRETQMWQTSLREAPSPEAKVPTFLDDLRAARDAEKPVQPVAPPNAVAPWQFDWRETSPPDLNPQWYGPNKENGRLGAKLLSQAQGDRFALSSVGMSFYAPQTRDYLIDVSFDVPYVYLDTGGMGPSGSWARMSLSISAFENDVKFGFYEDTYLEGSSMNILPLLPHFWSKEATAGSAWRALPVTLEAGHLYTMYFECLQMVGTWGPAGAQIDAREVYVTRADVKPR